MSIEKVNPVIRATVQQRKGRELVASRAFNIETFLGLLVGKLPTATIILGRHKLADGETFKFKFNGFNWTMKPLYNAGDK